MKVDFTITTALALNVTLGTQVIEAREMVNFTPQGPIAVVRCKCILTPTRINARYSAHRTVVSRRLLSKRVGRTTAAYARMTPPHFC